MLAVRISIGVAEMKLGSTRKLVVGTMLGSVALTGLMTAVPAVASSPRVVTTDPFSAVAPTRILDTRSGLGLPGGVASVVGEGEAITLHVADTGGLPHSVDAVVMNVTAVSPTKSTFISIYPGDLASPPAISNINVGLGKIVPNLVTVQVDAAGDVKLYNARGSVNLVADVTGYYSSGAADTFYPLAPARLLDTRYGIGVPLASVGAGEVVDVIATNSLGIAPNADAVVLNVTAVGATRPTFVQVYPKPATVGLPPVFSNVNVVPGQAVANLVTVGIGADGSIELRNAFGNVDLVADVAGYFAPDAGGSLYTPVTPTRLLDTRGFAPTVTKTPVGPGGVVDLQVTGQQGMPDGATAALFNYTVVAPTLGTYVQAYPTPPSGHLFPTTSNINLGLGEIRANLASVQIGAGGDIRLRNQAGITDLIVDLAGYYTNATSPNVPGPPPTDAPPTSGVTVSGTFLNVHPSPYGKVSLNVTTNVDTAPLTATAMFRTGSVKINSSSVGGTPVQFTFGVGTAPINVAVPVVLTATSADLGATATTTVVFSPIALACRAAASPPNPAQHAFVDIVIGTAPGANISAVFHFKATTPTQNSHADKAGRGDVNRNIGGATVGFRVPVTITVTLGPKTATCATTFTPIA